MYLYVIAVVYVIQVLTSMTYTTAVCTMENSLWWTEELSEICRVSFQNKFWKLLHLVGFIIRIHFTYFGNKDISWIPKACFIITVSFSTKCSSFHNFTFRPVSTKCLKYNRMKIILKFFLHLLIYFSKFPIFVWFYIFNFE